MARKRESIIFTFALVRLLPLLPPPGTEAVDDENLSALINSSSNRIHSFDTKSTGWEANLRQMSDIIEFRSGKVGLFMGLHVNTCGT